MQSILVIGDGDFSFSRSLAIAFCSGENLVSTSLDSYAICVGGFGHSTSRWCTGAILRKKRWSGPDNRDVKELIQMIAQRSGERIFPQCKTPASAFR
ncbi:hypothetical protein E2562_024918 [Oryza meyeriana var. granulata]|uniref:25S rRNA (uridine-N(3))-methyltransferase BMT5-like domain-containing protein n=1 Tax=Oryza meyeriana var. granulata TaxID=110450 RepID=A0A6G1DQ75_9ORYZ|nr:hypothetical protein E2562_024918 [Oryza meyeriana var. granulata]